jgi:four helix bundle protein
MTKDELKYRTKQFALAIVKLVDELPNTKSGYAIGNQLVRSGTSVAAEPEVMLILSQKSQ